MKRVLGALVAFSLVLAGTAFGQGITTAGISGTVTDKQGQPAGGVAITVLHEPSGTRATTTTRANGQFNLTGLRVGGPYTVTATPPGLPVQTQNEIYLSAEQNTEVDFTQAPGVVKMEAFTVAGSRDTTFGTGMMGPATTLNARDIAEVATVRRNIQDIAILDSRLFLGSLDQGGQMSAAGQNFRYNSFLIDGVQAGDTFGLNSNGFSSLRSPIPLDAIASFNVELSPFDSRFAGFTGALLNAIIKSGTNEFHGSGRYERTDQELRAKNPVSGARETFKERTFTGTFGGPIIPNKLFFFLAYDDFRRESAPPQPNFIPDATQLAAVIARAQALGYNPGNLNANNIAKQTTTIAKIDWNISEAHRLAFTYRRNYGNDIAFANLTGSTTTSLSNYWFTQPRNTDSYTAQLFSNWTPNLRTEVDLSYTRFNGSPQNNGTPFPQVQVQGLSGTRLDTGAAITNGAIFLGTESSRQLNQIVTKDSNGKFIADYSLGNHTITFGLEDDITKYKNAFVQFTDGYYTFANLAAWQAGTPPSAYQLATAYPGFSINDAIAQWRYEAYGVFLQDSWRVNSNLTVLAGLRYDYPYVPQKPPVAAGFATAGFTLDDGTPITRNDTTNSGNGTLAPRVGFNYKLPTDRKTQLRGGVGLFQGKNPAVWISNAYSNAGSVASTTASTTQLPTITFQPDVNKQTPPSGTLPTPNINITDPGFKQPSIWKTNLGLDHHLPFGGITASIEGYYWWNQENLNTMFLNYKVDPTTPTLPDGRIHYAGTVTNSTSTSVNGRRRIATFADVYYLTNSKKGESRGVTLSLARPMKNHWGWRGSWTHGRATEVSPMTSSVAGSNYSNRASFNPNEDVASISNTNLKDRLVGTLTREFEFVRGFPTTFTLVGQARSGHPYSWVFRGDANGDGFAFNDLLYVPTGPNDPRVTWASTTERDAFFAFVNSTDLKNYAGGHAPRNSETSPWVSTIDLQISQQIPIYRKVKGELYLNLINIGNMIDKHWGLLNEVPFSYRRAVAAASAYNATTGQWAYTFNSGTLDGIPTVANDQPVSRWQIVAGVRVQF
jgi:hypothetical protein